MQRTQLVGAPDWAETARYDIVAKAEGDIQGTPPGGPAGPLNSHAAGSARGSIQASRAPRNAVRWRFYALTLARADGKLGADFAPLPLTVPRCAAAAVAPVGACISASGERPPCGIARRPNQVTAGGVRSRS